ncbi:MAG: alpha/beta hydrolase [Myxococcales bacterium]|jgi:pimeloyl-ACP methyl ester carboxylesterase|nr:alpha/beta hydrolase [Myxococcales bacterium]
MIGDFEHVFIDGTVRLHALVKGEGPLVLMCHGFPGLSYSFRHQLRALAEAGFRAVALDMRGYGRSDRPLEVEAYQAAHVESDLVATLAHFGEERAFLVGHDFGARAVLGFSLRHPSRVRGVVSLAVPYGVQYRGARSKEKTAPRKPSEVYAEIAKNHFFHMHYFQAKGPAEAELGARPREFLERIHWALSAEGRLLDWTQFPSEGTGYLDVLAEPARPLPWGWLSEADLDYVVAEYTRVGGDATFVGGLNSYRVTDLDWAHDPDYGRKTLEVPMLLVSGERDPVRQIVADRSLDAMRERAPKLVDVRWIEGAGHFVQQEKPEETNRELLAFFSALA